MCGIVSITTVASGDIQSLVPSLTRDYPFGVEHLSAFIGTQVSGVDLGQPQGEGVRAALQDLLWHRGVIFFHDQHLTPEQQLRATRLFGNPRIAEDYRQGSPLPGIGVIDGDNLIAGRVSRWHSDLSSAPVPPTVRLLQAKVLPGIGGDTLWASTDAAYYRLSEPLRQLADSLTAIHANTPIRYSQADERKPRFQWAEHPVVRVHPATGRRSLYVNPRFTQEIPNFRPHESAATLKLFYDHITQPEFQVRFRWREGALAIWDNRNTIHFAADDYGDERRVMHSSDIEPEPVIGLTDIGDDS
jgi:alpha-ketoglutarate-dependent taurine dioxygenase